MKLLLFSLCVIFSNWAFAKKGELTFPSTVEISPRHAVTLYDIVESKGVSVDVLESLKGIEIGDQKTQTISKSDLIRRLRGVNTFFLFPLQTFLCIPHLLKTLSVEN